MPALLLKEKSVTVLRELVSNHGDNIVLKELRIQLNEPLKAEQEGALYPQGTVISHRCLVQVARWAASQEDKLRQEFELCKLVRGAQVAIATKPKPVRVSCLPLWKSILLPTTHLSFFWASQPN